MGVSSEEEWAERAAAFLKHKLRETEVTYVDLAKRLKKTWLQGSRDIHDQQAGASAIQIEC